MSFQGVFARAALCAFLALSMGLRPAVAQSDPPISISGFTYRLTGAIHAHRCSRASCGGEASLVSYVFYPPKPALTFQDYKNQRRRLEQQLKAQAAPGVSIKFKPPKETKEKPFSIFESRRTMSAPGRSPQITVSRTIVARAVIIELISSAENEKTADINLALFTIPALAMAISDGKTRLRMQSRD
jgi:hypothetical protein